MKSIKKRGAQPGNTNALGNKGGAPYRNTNAVGHGPPYGNRNAVTHGLYSHIGIYARREFDYYALSETDKILFDEMIKDTGDISTAVNLFRVYKFDQSGLPLNYKDPYMALLQSAKLLMK